MEDFTPLDQTFMKYYGQEQDGKNDYETGCIQTANALMPQIILLKMEVERLKQEVVLKNFSK